MKKIIFLFFFSSVVFADDFSADDFPNVICSALSPFSVAQPSTEEVSPVCSFLSVVNNPVKVVATYGEDYQEYYRLDFIADQITPPSSPPCPLDNLYFNVFEWVYNDTPYIHPQCLADNIAYLPVYGDAFIEEMCSTVMFNSIAVSRRVALYCSAPGTLSVSEQTAKKRNDLVSESNSKLGSIASSSSTITNLLQQINDSLSALLSNNYGVFGTNAKSPNAANKDNPDSPEYEPTLLDSDVSVSKISALISASGSCPSPISLSVMGFSHSLSYQPICDFLSGARPVVIAAARVAAAWLVIGAL